MGKVVRVMVSKEKDGREYRHIPLGNLEVRSNEENGQRTIGGYVNKFNLESHVMRDYWGDAFVEVIAPGAFDKTLEVRNQKALWNHNRDLVLGSVGAGTLTLFTDDIGLRCEINLPNTTWGNDAWESVQRGDVDGMSFGFRVIDDKWSKIEKNGEEIYKRSITEAEVFEVSPCVFPAYPDSQISCRSLENYKECCQAKINQQHTKRKLELELELSSSFFIAQGGEKHE